MNSWEHRAEFIVLLITLIGGFYTLDAKIERQIESVQARIDQQSARSDRLYEMFIELVKTR